MRAQTVACIGGAHLDRRGVHHGPLVLGASNPGAVFTNFGGVARNIAMNLASIECGVLLASRVGNDEPGRQVLSQSIDTSLVTVSDRHPTASYTAVLEPGGELVLGLADTNVYEEVTPAVPTPALPRLREAALWFVDANLPGPTIEWLLDTAGEIPTAVDAVSVPKSQRLARLLPVIRYLLQCRAGRLAFGRQFHRRCGRCRMAASGRLGFRHRLRRGGRDCRLHSN